MAETVTVEKSYFETLLRRAQFHAARLDASAFYAEGLPAVTIPKSEHDSLLAVSKEYATLRNSLLRGGIAEETLNILISSDEQENENRTTTANSTVESTSISQAFMTQIPCSTTQSTTRGKNYTYGGNEKAPQNAPRNGAGQPREISNYHHHHENYQGRPHVQEEHLFTPDNIGERYEKRGQTFAAHPDFRHPQYQKYAKRSVLIANLPEGCTHAEVTASVRGGMLLEIHLRTHDRTVSLSFLEESAAQEFFRHVKRHDLYIRGKRVEIKWNERQFILPGHVANKISTGATRNLVIINRTARHTEKAIRDDLEHIHNLVVICVNFSEKNAYIFTNSVHNAIFARTCMMSRSVYKGSKIEWAADECDVPLEEPTQRRSANIPIKGKNAPPANRFQSLTLDTIDDDSDIDGFDGISLSTAHAPSVAGVVI